MKLLKHLRPLAKLSAGTVFVAILPVLTAPVTARLYDTDAFGRLGIVITISNIGALLYTAGFAKALLLAETSEQAEYECKSLFQFLWLLLLGFLLLAGASFAVSLDVGVLLTFSAVSIPLISAISVANAWMVFSGKFGGLSVIRITQAVVTAACSILLGTLAFDQYGIIVGYCVGQLASLLIVSRELPSPGFQPKRAYAAITAIVAKNRKLFIVGLPAEILNVLTNSLPTFFLASFAGTSQLGTFNMAMRLLEAPASLISGALTQYFQARAVSRNNSKLSLLPIVLSYSGVMFVVCTPLLVLFVFVAPDLAAWALGDSWRMSGVFAQYLSAYAFLRVVVSPVTFVIFLRQAFLVSLWMDIMLFVLVSIGFGVALLIFESTLAAVIIFSAIYSLSYCVSFALSCHYAPTPAIKG